MTSFSKINHFIVCLIIPYSYFLMLHTLLLFLPFVQFTYSRFTAYVTQKTTINVKPSMNTPYTAIRQQTIHSLFALCECQALYNTVFYILCLDSIIITYLRNLWRTTGSQRKSWLWRTLTDSRSITLDESWLW